MKTLLTTILIVSSCFADYQSGKIDMHGGKDSYLYGNKKSSFTKGSMGMSMFIDNNASKNATRKKEKK